MVDAETLDDAETVETPRRRRRRASLPASSTAGHLLANPVVKAGLFVIGAVALASVAATLVGPRKMERDVYEPLLDALEPQAEKLKAEADELRSRITNLLEKSGPERRRMAKRLQSFIGHFRAD